MIYTLNELIDYAYYDELIENDDLVETKILLDTSILLRQSFDARLCEDLYEGFRGLRMVDEDIIASMIDSLPRINEAVMDGRVGIIEEVVEEMENHHSLLYDHCDWISRNRKNISLRTSYKRRAKLGESGDDKLNMLWDYVWKLDRILKNINEKDPRKDFSERQSKRYEYFLDLSFKYSKDIVARYVRDKSQNERSSFLGKNLGTNQKLVATALALTDKYNIFLASSDKDHNIMLGRIGCQVPFEEKFNDVQKSVTSLYIGGSQKSILYVPHIEPVVRFNSFR